MNNQQWASLIRIVLGVLLAPSSYLVLKGILTPDQASQLIPILEPIILAAGAAALGKWGHASNTSSALTAAVNSDSAPKVKVVSIDAPGRAVNIDPKTGGLVPATPAPAPAGPPVASVALAAIMALGLLVASHGASQAQGCATPDLGTQQGLAEAMVKLGYVPSGTVMPDVLSAAIKLFQSQKGLAQDAIAGSQTKAAIGSALCGTAQSGSVEGLIVSDLSAAITVAQAPPTLTNEVTCFTKLHDDLSATANLPAGAGLFTAYVVLVRKQAVLGDLQTDACLAVCGRAQQAVALPIVSRIAPTNLIPNVCQLARLFTP